MNRDLISVIVPVYKVEKYIERCIISILNQTYKNLEIILIDDGSPDNSGVICDDLAINDNRIKVIHKKNGGVSSARNVGLDNISKDSRYVCFVDSDDYISEKSIEYLYEGITENQADFCCNSSEKYFIDFNINPHKLLSFISAGGSYAPYAKLFKADIIRDNSIRYDTNLKCSEDALFIRQYLKYCSNLSLISKKVYCYNSGNEDSLSKKGYSDFALYYVKKLDALLELIENLPLTQAEKDSFISQRAVHGIKISFEHYYNHFKKDNLMSLFKMAYDNIHPYIKTLKINCSRYEKWYSFVGLGSKWLRFKNVYIKEILLLKIKSIIYKIKFLIKILGR